jgi:toxin-antitoxin system PIN domain toxin
VIAVDTNILVYAHRRDSEWHAAATERVRELAEADAQWAIPWPCVYEFIAIVTHPRIYDPPTPLEQALAQVDAWLESPSVVLLAEGIGHWQSLRSALTAAKPSGGRVHDARVAVLCAVHGVRELWTADRDFGRYPIATRNPLTR